MLRRHRQQHHTQLCVVLLAFAGVMSLGTMIAIVVIGGLLAWKLGSIALRILGVLMCAAGLLGLASPGTQSTWTAVLVLALGLLLWIAGHWLSRYVTTISAPCSPSDCSCTCSPRGSTRPAVGA